MKSIIRDIAYHMANNALSIYGRDERIIQDVLAEMRLQQGKNRLY